MKEIVFNKFPALIVKKDSPAEWAIKRLCEAGPIVPGRVLLVSNEEFDSLQQDVIAMDVPEPA